MAFYEGCFTGTTIANQDELHRTSATELSTLWKEIE